MKNIIFLLILLAVVIKNNFCNDSILSKFHQNGFKVRDLRADLVSYNEKYFNFFEIKTFKYNRTTPAINGTINVKINLKDKVEVLVQAYKFLSNEYRHFPIRFQVNLKKAFDANAIGVKGIRNCGNVTSYIFEKDVTYFACNFVIDETHLPPLIPSGKYKIDLKILYLNEEIANVCGYGEVYTPIEYPKD